MADFVVDTFTDTNGTSITSHTGETGATWTVDLGTSSNLFILSNRLFIQTSGTLTVRALPSGNPSSANYQLEFDLSVDSSTAAQTITLYARASGDLATDRYTATIRTDGTASLDKTVSSVDTNLDTAAGLTFADADTFTFILNGDSLIVNQNGSEILSATDGSLTGAGIIAILGATTAVGDANLRWAFLDFVAGDIPAGAGNRRRRTLLAGS